MSYDGRMHAWIATWTRLEAAEEFKRNLLTQPEFKSTDQMPDIYWSLLTTADIYARLATADTVVGFGVGGYLEEQEIAARECDQERSAKFADLFKDPSCTCEWDKSQCPIHGQGDDIAEDDDDGTC